MELETTAVDYFSLLPESLLLIILSLLPFKDAVRTSLLARRYRYMWRSSPNVEINENHFTLTLSATMNPSYYDNMIIEEDNYLTHIKRLMCIYFGNQWTTTYDHQLQGSSNGHVTKTTISRFSLAFSNPLEYNDDIQGFINFAITHKTKTLELDFSEPSWENDDNPLQTYKEVMDLPSIVYEYHFLESLKLVSCRVMAEDFVNISRLRQLSLGRVEVTTDEIKLLIKRCPLLEDLSLTKCFGAKDIYIKSSVLKRLVIDGCGDLLALTIITPRLKFFRYFGTIVRCDIRNLESLDEVEVDFGLAGFVEYEVGDQITDLLMQFHRAKSLLVCTYITQTLASSSYRWKVLPRLMIIETLKINTMFHRNEYFGIIYLLNSLPFLQKLQFYVDDNPSNIFGDYEAPCADIYFPPTFWTKITAPSSFIYTLKEVEIINFRGTISEWYFLSWVFQQGHVLQKLLLKVAQINDVEMQEYYRSMARSVGTWRSPVSTYDVNVVVIE